MNVQHHWNGLQIGQPIRLTKNVYHRMDHTFAGKICYEEPGKLIAQKGLIGTFCSKIDAGILVHFKNGVGSILGLVIDESALEAYTP